MARVVLGSKDSHNGSSGSGRDQRKCEEWLMKSKNSLSLFVVLAFAFVQLWTPSCIAKPLQNDLELALGQFEEATRELLLKHERQLVKPQRELATLVIRRIEELSRLNNQDEHIRTLKDLLSTLNTSASPFLISTSMKGQKIHPATGIGQEVASFYKTLSHQRQLHDRDIFELTQKFMKKHSINQKQTGNAHLSKLLLEFTQMRTGDDKYTIPKFPSDPELARQAYFRVYTSWNYENREVDYVEVLQAIADLYDDQQKAEKDGNDAAARAIAKLVDAATGRPLSDSLLGKKKSEYDELTNEARQTISDFAKRMNGEQVALRENLKKLGKAYAPHFAEYVAARFKGDESLEVAKGYFEEYYGYLGTKPEWVRMGPDAPLPSAGADIEPTIAAAKKKLTEIIEIANELESVARTRLMDSVGSLEDAQDDKERSAISRMRTWSNANYAQGIRGAMICDYSPDLPPKSKPFLDAYFKETERIEAKAKKEGEELQKRIEKNLLGLLKKKIKSHDFEQAYAILSHTKSLENPFQPFSILGGVMEIVFYRDVVLYDRKEGKYLIADKEFNDKKPVWVDRQAVILSRDEAVAKHQLPPNVGGTPEPYPGSRITTDTPLKIGDEISAFLDRAWRPARVDEISPLGLRLSVRNGIMGLDGEWRPFPGIIPFGNTCLKTGPGGDIGKKDDLQE